MVICASETLWTMKLLSTCFQTCDAIDRIRIIHPIQFNQPGRHQIWVVMEKEMKTRQWIITMKFVESFSLEIPLPLRHSFRHPQPKNHYLNHNVWIVKLMAHLNSHGDTEKKGITANLHQLENDLELVRGGVWFG